MHGRQQEVFAGFLTHTDAQIGALIDQLDEIGQLENTIVLLFSDNGASAEGGQFGSRNEHRFTVQIRDSVAENLAALDDWGGPRSYNHFSWAWAWAGNTPLRLWKRYTWLGGVRTPLIVHWPAGFAARGEVRSQFAHAIDLAPTVLDALGIPAPESIDGVAQQRVDGASLLATFDDAAAPAGRSTQYFEMLGSRSLYHRGWKVTTDHISTGVLDEEELAIGSRDFARDHWALFDLDADFSESTDRSGEHPNVVAELEGLWFAEAERNQVLPVDDTFLHRIGALIPNPYPGATPRVFLPDAGPVADESVPPVWGGFHITAEVTVPPAGAEGVLFALGDWNGGYALVAIDGRLVFCFSRAGELLEVVADEPVPPGPQVLGVTSVATGTSGSFSLLHGDRTVGHAEFDGALPFALQHGGTALRLGHDAGLPVTDRYAPPFPWTGALHRVVFGTPNAPGTPLADEIRAALHSD